MNAGTLGPGLAVGHWTHPSGGSGCTVVLLPRGNVTSCDIRGSSPSTRELAHLDAERKLTETHAILLTGGSAFGLAAATGVVAWLEERGIGYQTPIGVVPIVPAAVIFDLGVGDPAIRPGPEHGRAACEAARESEVPAGRVGAGAGATVGKWAGIEYRSPGGLGFGTAAAGDGAVRALAVVNPVGDIVSDDGRIVAGTTSPEPVWRSESATDSIGTNTVLVVVAFEAVLDKREVRWLAARGSDGVTQAVRPAHTRYDGDVTFAVATPGPHPDGPANLDILGQLATQATAAAVRAAVV